MASMMLDLGCLLLWFGLQMLKKADLLFALVLGLVPTDHNM
jgi:hypothetical protein